jgi:tetratricopeptide (TPR) repeat protein
MGKKSKQKKQKKIEEKKRKQLHKEQKTKQVSPPQVRDDIPSGIPGLSAETISQILRHEMLAPNQQQSKCKEDDVFAKFSQKLQAMQHSSNDELIQVLRKYGIDYRENEFIAEAKQFGSAYALFLHWKQRYSIPDCPGLEESIICEAIRLLTTRLSPDVVNNDRLDAMMQNGYSLLEEGDCVKACSIWLEVWDHLKKRFSPDMRSVDDAEAVLEGMQSLYNWCQDLEGELYNAGLDDPVFFEKQIQYCREFCTLFPKTDWLTIHNMKRAEAEAYFSLGMQEKGDAAFQSLVEEFPDYAWGYIGWGDMYCGGPVCRKIPVDYNRAESLYRQALNIASKEDRSDVLERLDRLEEERKKKV